MPDPGTGALYDTSGHFGAVGRRADLILTDDNPLGDIRALRQRVGVMLRGRWMPASELQRMLDRVAAANAGN